MTDEASPSGNSTAPIRTITPSVAPLEAARREARPPPAPVVRSSGDHQRIELGLNFWKPLLYFVGGSILALVIVLAAVECYNSVCMAHLYSQALTISSANSGMTLDTEKLRSLQAFLDDARESQQSFRAAWQQAAQLILVNLLLPVLTALLGYIFGVQQGRASEAAERRNDGQ